MYGRWPLVADTTELSLIPDDNGDRRCVLRTLEADYSRVISRGAKVELVHSGQRDSFVQNRFRDVPNQRAGLARKHFGIGVRNNLLEPLRGPKRNQLLSGALRR
jgi:hypothetical protein